MRKRQKLSIVFSIMICIMICLSACHKSEDENFSLEPVREQQTEQMSEETDTIFVYVCGAVVCEGVYELPQGARAYEAVEMAGGFREDAATSAINQAKVLQDATQLYVPTKEEAQFHEGQEAGKVNINLASKEELMTLPGVGQAKAESIIQYREEQGDFATIEDLMQISGIKEGLFEKIKDLITI